MVCQLPQIRNRAAILNYKSKVFLYFHLLFIYTSYIHHSDKQHRISPCDRLGRGSRGDRGDRGAGGTGEQGEK